VGARAHLDHGAELLRLAEYNSILSPEKVSSFAQQHVPGASSVFNAAHQAQNAFGSAQHYIGREGPQGE
jgi:4-hydroxyphenylpyruvate dioxygenase-like putative hemolysin